MHKLPVENIRPNNDCRYLGTDKKAEPQRIDAFELWCWRRLLRVPWTARRSNQSILKEINQSWIFIGRTDTEAETPVLWAHVAKSGLVGKDPDAGKDWRQECYQKVCVGGLAARHLNASKPARLLERKVYFRCQQLGWRGWQTSVQGLIPAPPPSHWQAGGESVYRQSDGGWVTCRNSTVSSNSHLQLVVSGPTSIILVVLGTVNL